ncbi:hypothetical protein BN13_650011 [Nostocoides jenkinsii Ben 74]|uniref:Uncharacterized protein n=1 Tax=Nostocoides jenkinsii Ben 74 TaxID=1193518 RepID=A0A077MFY3_9MICO|nr:hypothetical protein BN13_650011 [Tetrasphaera jenkinsii Ben 74]
MGNDVVFGDVVHGFPLRVLVWASALTS